MLETAQGLVVRVRPLTETSLVVQWVSREQGRLATVAKGARRPRSPLRGRLDLFFLAELVFQRSRRSDLHLLREVHVLEAHAGLRTDWERLRLASHAVRLLEQATETETPIPALFDLLLELVRHLDQHPARRRVGLAYEVRLLQLLGWEPAARAAPLSQEARALLQELATREWAALDALAPGAEAVREVEAWLERLWREEVGIRSVRPAGMASGT